MHGFGSPEALAWLSSHCSPDDSVELKTLLVPDADPFAEALTGRCAPSWSERQTYLLDTAGLHFVRAGVEVRLRLRARGRYDLSVSTRHNGTASRRTAPRGARVEFDVVPGTLWQDIEVRREVDPAAAVEAIAGTAAARHLLSAPQLSWARCGGRQLVDGARLRELAVHGPVVVRRLKVTAADLGLKRADLEHFRFPSGRERLELSTRCCPGDVSAAATALQQLLDERKVTVTGYRTKTSMWHDEIGADG